MVGVTSMIYTDTMVLRYFGTAFRQSVLDENLRDHLLLAPLALMELLSQLATEGVEDPFGAIQATTRIYNKHAGLLPWTDEVFRAAVFGLPPSHSTLSESLSSAVNLCLNA